MAGDLTNLSGALTNAWDTVNNWRKGDASQADVVAAVTAVGSAIAAAAEDFPALQTSVGGFVGFAAAYQSYLSDSEQMISSKSTPAQVIAGALGVVADGAAAVGAVGILTGQPEVALPSAVLGTSATALKVVVDLNAELINSAVDGIGGLLSNENIGSPSISGDLTAAANSTASSAAPPGWTITYDAEDGLGVRTAQVQNFSASGYATTDGSGGIGFTGYSFVQSVKYTDPITGAITYFSNDKTTGTLTPVTMVTPGSETGNWAVFGLIPGSSGSNLSGVTQPPSIDANGNVLATFAVGSGTATVALNPATGAVVNDPTAVTATIGGEPVTLLGLGGTTPFALISNDNSSVTASAVSSIGPKWR